jgi:hypothetical protein
MPFLHLKKKEMTNCVASDQTKVGNINQCPKILMKYPFYLLNPFEIISIPN